MTLYERLIMWLADRFDDVYWWFKWEGDRVLEVLLLVALILTLATCLARADEFFKITAYCACEKCCGKSDGITASGVKAKYGMIACNWLKFGTKVKIESLGVFRVADRGAKSLFGSPKNHIRHLDIYLPSHAQALNFGVKYLSVEVLK